jgi:hypothetical protein
MRTISIAILGLVAALVAKRFVPGQSGLTFTSPRSTHYLSFGILSFWFLLAMTVAFCLFHAYKAMRVR